METINVKEIINSLTIETKKFAPKDLVKNPWNARKINAAGHYDNTCVVNMLADGWNPLARTPVIATVKDFGGKGKDGKNIILIGHSQIDMALQVLESKTVSVQVMESVQKIPCRLIVEPLTIAEAKAISCDAYLRESSLTYWQLFKVAQTLSDVHYGKYLLKGGETAFKADIFDSLVKYMSKYETQESKGFLAPMFRAILLGGDVAKDFEAFASGEVKKLNTTAIREAFDVFKAHLAKNPLEVAQAKDIGKIEYYAGIEKQKDEKQIKKENEKIAEKVKRQEEYITTQTALYMTIINHKDISDGVKKIVKVFMSTKDIDSFIAGIK